MISPVKGFALTLYWTSTDKFISALLAQEVEGVEHPVYYLSMSLWGVEMDYSSIERYYPTLIFVTQKLCHYLLAHSFNLIRKFDPFKHYLDQLWQYACSMALQLNEFDITVVTHGALKSRIVWSFSSVPPREWEPLHENLPCVNVSSTHRGGGVRVILYAPDGTNISLSFILEFSCSNN